MNNIARAPEPSLRSQPTSITIDDQEIKVVMNLRFPRIVLFENFLTSSECEFLIRMATPHMKRSSVVMKAGTGSEINEARTSDGCSFPRRDNAFIELLDKRAAQLCNWPEERTEALQVLRYKEGDEYKPHFDFFMPNATHIPGPGGQRVGTLLVYLKTPEQGGGTFFPEIGMEIKPPAGSAVLFSYPNLFHARNTLHAGMPVISGEKWVATKWFREGTH